MATFERACCKTSHYCRIVEFNVSRNTVQSHSHTIPVPFRSQFPILLFFYTLIYSPAENKQSTERPKKRDAHTAHIPTRKRTEAVCQCIYYEQCSKPIRHSTRVNGNAISATATASAPEVPFNNKSSSNNDSSSSSNNNTVINVPHIWRHFSHVASTSAFSLELKCNLNFNASCT